MTNYCSYDILKEIVNKRGIISKINFFKRYKDLINETGLKIPSSPNISYKNNGWVDWGTFLNNEVEYYTYSELKKIVNDLNILKCEDYWKIYKTLTNNNGIKAPRDPNSHYFNIGWVNWIDFLEKSNIYYTYNELKDKIIGQGIKTQKEYNIIYKNLVSVDGKKAPANPLVFYGKNKWKSWGKFLGDDVEYFNYSELKKRVIEEGIVNSREYVDQYKNLNINNFKAPRFPQKFYKENGWKSWDAFLKTDDISAEYYIYNELKNLVKVNNINTCSDYWDRYKSLFNKEKIAPRNPDMFYLNGEWTGWGDFTEKDENYKRVIINPRAKTNFCTYDELKIIIIKHKIHTKKEYRNQYKKLKIEHNCLIPGDPEYTYLNSGWNGWDSFSEKPDPINPKIKYIKYNELKIILKSENIENKYDYFEFAKLFNNKNELKAPHLPESVYSKLGWNGWNDFLSTNTRYFSYEELSKIVIEKKVGLCEEYYKAYKSFSKGGLIAPNYPNKTYKNKWISWGSFLGTENLYYDYEELKEVLKKQKVNSSGEYRRNYKTLKDENGRKAPFKPYMFYKDKGWIDWYDVIPDESYFFNTQNVKTNKNNARSISIGEFEIMKFLDENNVEYKHNRPIKGCKYKKALLFDFQIPDKKICIEYDGKQHYYPISYFGGEKSFEENKIRDSIKDEFCKENNIKMIRIPYSLNQKEVKELLNKELLTN